MSVFIKMALIVLFTLLVLLFTAVTSSPRMNAPTHATSIYRTVMFGWSAEVFITSCNRSQSNISQLHDAPQLIWSALPQNAIDNAEKRLP